MEVRASHHIGRCHGSIVADVEARSAALMVSLGAKAGTQNIDRILRLPGTINIPNAAKLEKGRVRCPTKMLAFNGASYPLEAFAPGMSEDGAAIRTKNKQKTNKTTKRAGETN